MKKRLVLSTLLLIVFTPLAFAQDDNSNISAELELIKSWVGVWDAEFEVWPQGPEQPSMKFKGVETNRAFGTHWIASDLDSEMMGQKMTVHSIVGYDLDLKKMAGKIIDQGPYAAKLIGEYDQESKTVNWTTTFKDPSGKPAVQKTSIKQISETERLLVLNVPAEEEGKFRKMMEIKFVKRK